jgi:hypothetical protein
MAPLVFHIEPLANLGSVMWVPREKLCIMRDEGRAWKPLNRRLCDFIRAFHFRTSIKILFTLNWSVIILVANFRHFDRNISKKRIFCQNSFFWKEIIAKQICQKLSELPMHQSMLKIFSTFIYLILLKNAKSSYGWLPLEQHHKIRKKNKKKNTHTHTHTHTHTETDRQPKLKTLFLHLCQK